MMHGFDPAEFWANVSVGHKADPDACWIWEGPITEDGYGLFKSQRAHRVALWLSGVPTRYRTDVDHMCKTRMCVNPFHLQVLRHSDHSRLTAKRDRKH